MSENELVSLPRSIVDPREEVEAFTLEVWRKTINACSIPQEILMARCRPIPTKYAWQYLSRLMNEHTVRAVYPFCRDKDGNLCVAVPTKPLEPVYKPIESKINEKTNP